MSERGPHELSRIEGDSASATGAPSTLGVGADQALAGLPVSGPGAQLGLARFRLSPMAAGALRAAVDCLAGDAGVRTLRVMGDESVLDVRCENIDPDGLLPAAGVIETAGGNLGPQIGEAGVWTVRMPVLSAREHFLMFEQGTLSLALPWHSVVRVRLVAKAALRALAEHEGAGVLPTLEPEQAGLEEQPALLIGHGFKRAYVLADRLVWRLPAEPVEAVDPRPHPMLGPMLMTSEGRHFWLLDVAALLSDVPRLAVPSVRVPPTPIPAAPRPAVSPPSDARAEVKPEQGAPTAAPEPAPLPERRMAAPARPPLRLIELTSTDVTPLGGDDSAWIEALDQALTEVLGPPPAPARPEARIEPTALPDVVGAPREIDLPVLPPAAPMTPSAESAPAPLTEPPPSPRRALIAEDSITARIFLQRLLEQHGFSVKSVRSSQALRVHAAREPWDLVFADVELPDARAARALDGLAANRRDGTPAQRVALVRDAEDMAAAHAVGVVHALFKPFEREHLERLLMQLGALGDPADRPA